jgi:poly-gamma-glutamate capsule biosynthesis protein CapA/YwtB (metallophosphatase superfamily)
MVPIAFLGVVASLLVAGCTGEEPEALPPPTTPETASTPSPTTPSSTLPPDEPALAFAINIRRDRLDLSRREAASLMSGDDVTWSSLGQAGGRVRLVEGRGALDRVEDDARAMAVVPVEDLRPTVQVATVGQIDPVITPSTYPIGDPPVSRPRVTTMTIVGDIMLGRRVGAATPGDPGAALQPMSTSLAAADLTIGNLESTLSRAGRPTQGADSFAGDPAVLTALDQAGFDVLSLANNHTGDFGQRALVQTVRRLDASPIEPVGAGRDIVDAWRPAIVEHSGVTFGFVAFNAIGETPRATPKTPGAAEIRMSPRTGPLSQADLARTATLIRRLKDQVDVVIVLPHWGDQYTHQPVPDQRRVGRSLVNAGADLVVGGHPHWVQGIQTHRGSMIVHSLGNFVFDMDFSIPTQEGVTMQITFWGDTLMQARLVPYVIGPDFAPRPATGSRARSILNDVWQSSDAPFGN